MKSLIKASPKQQKAVILFVCLLLLALSYGLCLKSQIAKRKAAVVAEARLYQVNKEARTAVRQLPIYKKQQKTMHSHLAKIIKQLPAKQEMAGLLQAISECAESAGLQCLLLSPQDEIVQPLYVELSIKIQLVGSYLQLQHFLQAVAALPYLLTWPEWTIKRNALSPDALSFQAKAKIYRYLP